PVDLPVAARIRGLAHLDLAEPLARPTSLAPGDAHRTHRLGRIEEDAQRLHPGGLRHEGRETPFQDSVPAFRAGAHLVVEGTVDRVIGLGTALVLLERQPLRLGLLAEDVAGVDVLEVEGAGDELGDSRLAAPREAGDGYQHASIIPAFGRSAPAYGAVSDGPQPATPTGRRCSLGLCEADQ